MARFPQLDRLADNEEWPDWQYRPRGHSRSRPRVRQRDEIPTLDQIITSDGRTVVQEDDD